MVRQTFNGPGAQHRRRVTTAVLAKGDLSRSKRSRSTFQRGEKSSSSRTTINTMGRSGSTPFASEVTTRPVRERGQEKTEGKLGGPGGRSMGVAGRARLEGPPTDTTSTRLAGKPHVPGSATSSYTWTTRRRQRRPLEDHHPSTFKGEILQLKDTNQQRWSTSSTPFASEGSRPRRPRGRPTEGKARRPGPGQGAVGRPPGRISPTSVQPRWPPNPHGPRSANIADVTTPPPSRRRGDLSPARKITVDVKGEILQLKNTITTMVRIQLNSLRLRGFTARSPARGRATRGQALGGQAARAGASPARGK